MLFPTHIKVASGSLILVGLHDLRITNNVSINDFNAKLGQGFNDTNRDIITFTKKRGWQLVFELGHLVYKFILRCYDRWRHREIMGCIDRQLFLIERFRVRVYATLLRSTIC